MRHSASMMMLKFYWRCWNFTANIYITPAGFRDRKQPVTSLCGDRKGSYKTSTTADDGLHRWTRVPDPLVQRCKACVSSAHGWRRSMCVPWAQAPSKWPWDDPGPEAPMSMSMGILRAIGPRICPWDDPKPEIWVTMYSTGIYLGPGAPVILSMGIARPMGCRKWSHTNRLCTWVFLGAGALYKSSDQGH